MAVGSWQLAGGVALAALLSAGVPAPSSAQGGACAGETVALGVPQKPGPRLRFGVTPSGAAGQLGPFPAKFRRDRPNQILAALAKLRPSRGPFVTHHYSSWRNAGATEDKRVLDLARLYGGNGYLVEFVLRYHPSASQEGDVAGFAQHVRRMVRLLGPDRQVKALQIANEVNFTVSPDSSDGAFAGARDALIQGVIAAKDEARKRGHDQLEIGFNWVYRLDTQSERTFWGHLRDHGGPAFRAAVDWIGLDAYPGTFFPPASAGRSERDSLVDAMSLMRCYARDAGIADRVPIHVQENGFPTSEARGGYPRQAQTLETMVRTFHDFRGTYNVRDYRWFNLRDAETDNPNFQQHYGLMEDDYTPKPAFWVYERLIEELGDRTSPPGATALPRLGLRLAYGRRRSQATGRLCARSRLSAKLTGPGIPSVRRTEFRLRGRSVGSDGAAPFKRTIKLKLAHRERVRRVKARVTLLDGRRLTVSRTFRGCARGR